jgi:hypothetical protein
MEVNSELTHSKEISKINARKLQMKKVILAASSSKGK